MKSGDTTAWLRLARRYIWWQAPKQAICNKHKLMAQVMNLGTIDDVAILRALVDDDALRAVLADASPGWFSERSWHYWHQMLGEADLVDVPAMPVRTFGEPVSCPGAA